MRKSASRSTASVAMGILAAGLQSAFSASPVAAAELIWTGDFETGDYSQYFDKLSGGSSRAQKKLVTSPVRAGNYATQLTITSSGEDGNERAELRSDPGIHFEWDGPEYWVGFSFLFTEWESTAWTFMQIHAPNEVKGDPCDYAGNTFTIGTAGTDSNGTSEDLRVTVIENGGVSTGKGAFSNNTTVHRYPFPIGAWQDYVVNLRLSTEGKGFYRIWKNGKEIYSKTGLTNVNYRDSCGNLIPEEHRSHNGLHLGIYGPGDESYRRIFYDEVRVAVGSDGYDLVVPGGSQSAPSPPRIAIE